jgi:hypothetical protein
MTLRKREYWRSARGSTRSHSVENWLWKRLWNCLKADHGMMITGNNKMAEKQIYEG